MSVVLWMGAHWWEILLVWALLALMVGTLLGKSIKIEEDAADRRSRQEAVRSSRRLSRRVSR